MVNMFNIFINNLDAAVECIPNKLSGDTKLGDAVDSLEGRETTQRDPDRLEHWTVSNTLCSIKENAGHCIRDEVMK